MYKIYCFLFFHFFVFCISFFFSCLVFFFLSRCSRTPLHKVPHEHCSWTTVHEQLFMNNWSWAFTSMCFLYIHINTYIYIYIYTVFMNMPTSIFVNMFMSRCSWTLFRSPPGTTQKGRPCLLRWQRLVHTYAKNKKDARMKRKTNKKLSLISWLRLVHTCAKKTLKSSLLRWQRLVHTCWNFLWGDWQSTLTLIFLKILKIILKKNQTSKEMFAFGVLSKPSI